MLLVTQMLSFAATAASTLIAAALFNPLAQASPHLAGRRFNRARYDADLIVAAFAARLQDAADLAAVRADLASTVRTALEPGHRSVWTWRGGS